MWDWASLLAGDRKTAALASAADRTLTLRREKTVETNALLVDQAVRQLLCSVRAGA